jgi:nucleoid-associated protein YgaU
MVTIPYWLRRYLLPAGFLLLATGVLLLARAGLHDGEAAPAIRSAPPRPAPPAARAHTRSARASEYSVRSGDTLETIAERFGTTVDRLLELNPGIDPCALRVGQTVRVE